VSERLIAVTVGISRSTVGEYLRRAAVIGVTWPVPEGMDDGELERRLFTPPTFEEKPPRPLPDWTVVHRELKRRGVTLLLLWEEYQPVGKMSLRNSNCSSGMPSGTLMWVASAKGTRRYSACPPG
jgi:transposase